MASLIAGCCCTDELPIICPDVADIRLRITGVDAAKCACAFAIIIGSNAIKVTMLNVDGTRTIPNSGGGVYLSSTVPGGVMTIEYYNDQTCTALNNTCNANDLFIQYTVDCFDLNAQGQPRITNIQIRSGIEVGAECAPPTPEQTHNFAFWYDSTSCGGTYYHGDVVPNGGPLGASCDRTDPVACLPSAGYLSTGGTVQAVP